MATPQRNIDPAFEDQLLASIERWVERELKPKRTEWHRFADMPRRSIDYFNDFAGQDFTDLQVDGQDVYQLRPEQEDAVQQALEAFGNGATDVLWNAKPRFGKTLTTYDLMRRLGVTKALIVEQNHGGQFAKFLKGHYALPATVETLHRPGPLPIRPVEILSAVTAMKGDAR